jgi:hypothetical protein
MAFWQKYRTMNRSLLSLLLNGESRGLQIDTRFALEELSGNFWGVAAKWGAGEHGFHVLILLYPRLPLGLL